MGQGFYSKCYNDSGQSFNGTDTNDNCMYDTQNLSSLPTGSSSYYVEMKNSGSCFFESSYLFEGFALPGTPSGQYNFILGLCSGSSTLSEGSPWVAQEVSYGGYNFYVWTLPNGIPAQIQGITNCGDQLCINWLIPSMGDDKTNANTTDTEIPSAPVTAMKSGIPEDGSDYQGEPSVK